MKNSLATSSTLSLNKKRVLHLTKTNKEMGGAKSSNTLTGTSITSF